MAKSGSKIVKRGIIAVKYKYTISDTGVVTLKGEGELANYGEPLKMRFTAENIVIADGITSIGDTVFWSNESLRTIRIPETVTRIGSSAFGRCHRLEAPILPDSLVEIDNCAFDECYGFERIVLPRNLKTLPMGVFRNCKNLKAVDLSNVERIGEDVFENCRSLKQVVIPATVKYIGEKAFENCESLETVIFSSNDCKIEDNIFVGCQALKRVVLPASYAYRNLGNLWGRDYTSLVNDIVEFLPYEGEYPIEAIEAFYREHTDKDPKIFDDLEQAEKSLGLNESTTMWGFATLTKTHQYNEYNSHYVIRFEEFSEKITDAWFFCSSLRSFLQKQFLSKPVDKFYGLTNDYTRYIYKWERKVLPLQNRKPDPDLVQACRLLGEEIMTPYYTLDENEKITRLEEPAEMVDTADALEGFMKLVGNTNGMMGDIVRTMIDTYGAVKTCRVLGHMMTAGNIYYDEREFAGKSYGKWAYYSRSIYEQTE